MTVPLNTKKSIGGFFETERLMAKSNGVFHPAAMAVTSGRACLKQIVRSSQATLIHVPFYICDSVLTVIREAGAEYKFYNLTEDFSPVSMPLLADNELFLYVNYFGLKNDVAERLKAQYGQRLILDQTQAFFETGDLKAWSFNSARKFFGVPDGAYLYAPVSLDNPTNRNENLITKHLTKRSENALEAAYLLYQENEGLVSADWLDMSQYSKTVLEHLDYNQIQSIRNQNFRCYHQAFDSLNQLSLPLTVGTAFCYPLWLNGFPEASINKESLHEQGIFIPTLWKDVLARSETGFALEKSWSAQLLCLPLDHRYSENDCQQVIESIQKLLNSSRRLQSC